MKALTGLSGLSAIAQTAGTQDGPRAAGAADAPSWTNASAITASDDSRATIDVPFGESSGALSALTFGFSIPGGSTILGIEVKLERSKSGSGVVGETDVQLLKAGSGVGSPISDANDWPTTDTVATYGGVTSLWGTTWSASDVNNTNFGVQFVMTEGSVSDVTLRVDQVRITIWYE